MRGEWECAYCLRENDVLRIGCTECMLCLWVCVHLTGLLFLSSCLISRRKKKSDIDFFLNMRTLILMCYVQCAPYIRQWCVQILFDRAFKAKSSWIKPKGVTIWRMHSSKIQNYISFSMLWQIQFWSANKHTALQNLNESFWFSIDINPPSIPINDRTLIRCDRKFYRSENVCVLSYTIVFSILPYAVFVYARLTERDHRHTGVYHIFWWGKKAEAFQITPNKQKSNLSLCIRKNLYVCIVIGSASQVLNECAWSVTITMPPSPMSLHTDKGARAAQY